MRSRDSSVATGWTVRGSNPGGGEIFRTRPDRPWGPPSPPYNGYRVFPGGKTTEAWRWPSTPSKAEVKEGVELYLYSPSGLVAACSRVNYTLYLYVYTRKCSCKHCYVNDMYHMIYITQLCKYHKLHTASAPNPTAYKKIPAAPWSTHPIVGYDRVRYDVHEDLHVLLRHLSASSEKWFEPKL
jgi:hypothetical protein